MEKTKVYRKVLPDSFTYPCAAMVHSKGKLNERIDYSKSFKNFLLDRKCAKNVFSKYTRFMAKQDLQNDAISEGTYKEILKQLNFKK